MYMYCAMRQYASVNEYVMCNASVNVCIQCNASVKLIGLGFDVYILCNASAKVNVCVLCNASVCISK